MVILDDLPNAILPPKLQTDIKIGGVHYLSNDYNSTYQAGYNSGNDKTPNMSASLKFKTTDGADDQTREITWYGLADYNFGDRYYVSAGLSAQA